MSLHNETTDKDRDAIHDLVTKKGYVLTPRNSTIGPTEYKHPLGSKLKIHDNATFEHYHNGRTTKSHLSTFEDHIASAHKTLNSQHSEETPEPPTPMIFSEGFVPTPVSIQLSEEQFSEEHNEFKKSYPTSKYAHGKFKGDGSGLDTSTFHSLVKKHGGDSFDDTHFAIPHDHLENFHSAASGAGHNHSIRSGYRLFQHPKR